MDGRLLARLEKTVHGTKALLLAEFVEADHLGVRSRLLGWLFGCGGASFASLAGFRADRLSTEASFGASRGAGGLGGSFVVSRGAGTFFAALLLRNWSPNWTLGSTNAVNAAKGMTSMAGSFWNVSPTSNWSSPTFSPQN